MKNIYEKPMVERVVFQAEETITANVSAVGTAFYGLFAADLIYGEEEE